MHAHTSTSFPRRISCMSTRPCARCSATTFTTASCRLTSTLAQLRQLHEHRPESGRDARTAPRWRRGRHAADAGPLTAHWERGRQTPPTRWQPGEGGRPRHGGRHVLGRRTGANRGVHEADRAEQAARGAGAQSATRISPRAGVDRASAARARGALRVAVGISPVTCRSHG
jgi:hypothetical protein